MAKRSMTPPRNNKNRRNNKKGINDFTGLICIILLFFFLVGISNLDINYVRNLNLDNLMHNNIWMFLSFLSLYLLYK